jgi:threonine dehydratase
MPSTPLIKFDSVYLKREDQNQTGSAKDRAISLQVHNLLTQSLTSAVISSSGNAAISALYYCQQADIDLTIFVSPNIDSKKLKLIQSLTKNIIISPQPNSNSIKYSRQNRSYLLRQSTDPIALIGYQEIAKELLDQLPKITSLFIPVGSGTTLLGISKLLPQSVKLFAVQPASYCPIASTFDSNIIPEPSTITDALSVKYLPLKNQVIGAIKMHSGSGIVVQNQAVVDSQNHFIRNSISTSAEGALTFAGYNKIKNDSRFQIGDYPVILLTGASR